MSEITLQWVQLIKLILLSGIATLYGFGGVRGKWKRRIIAPLVFGVSIMGISLWTKSLSFWYIASVLFLYGAYSIGYGENSKLRKLTNNRIIPRVVAGLSMGLAALPIAWITRSWLLFGLHIFLTTLITTVLGVWNPTKSARAEESIIGFNSVFLPFMGMI